MKHALKAVCLLALLTVAPAQATPVGTVVGGASLIDAGDANQLATWLNQGDIDLERLFTYSWHDMAAAQTWHAAVDGKGPTFTVLRANYNGTDYLIGGYNPLSWDSDGGFHMAATPSEATAFLFNLTTGTVQRERYNTFGYNYQTLNDSLGGPVFGYGPDLRVTITWESYGYTYPYNYGGGYDSPNLITGTQNTLNFTVTDLETFSVTPHTVPEPAGPVLLGLGLALAAAVRRRRGPQAA